MAYYWKVLQLAIVTEHKVINGWDSKITLKSMKTILNHKKSSLQAAEMIININKLEDEKNMLIEERKRIEKPLSERIRKINFQSLEDVGNLKADLARVAFAVRQTDSKISRIQAKKNFAIEELELLKRNLKQSERLKYTPKSRKTSTNILPPITEANQDLFYNQSIKLNNQGSNYEHSKYERKSLSLENLSNIKTMIITDKNNSGLPSIYQSNKGVLPSPMENLPNRRKSLPLFYGDGFGSVGSLEYKGDNKLREYDGDKSIHEQRSGRNYVARNMNYSTLESNIQENKETEFPLITSTTNFREIRNDTENRREDLKIKLSTLNKPIQYNGKLNGHKQKQFITGIKKMKNKLKDDAKLLQVKTKEEVKKQETKIKWQQLLMQARKEWKEKEDVKRAYEMKLIKLKEEHKMRLHSYSLKLSQNITTRKFSYF